jgi:phosphatidylinositol 4-phosphatase
MHFACRLTSDTADYSLFYYFMLWFTFLLVSLTFIFVHGIRYVSWPRLIPMTDVIHYNGIGYRSAHHGMGLGRTAKAFTVAQSMGVTLLSKGRSRATSRIEEIEMGTRKRID